MVGDVVRWTGCGYVAGAWNSLSHNTCCVRPRVVLLRLNPPPWLTYSQPYNCLYVMALERHKGRFTCRPFGKHRRSWRLHGVAWVTVWGQAVPPTISLRRGKLEWTAAWFVRKESARRLAHMDATDSLC